MITKYPANVRRLSCEFLTTDLRIIAEQVASALAVCFRQYRFWDESYSLINFNAPAWKTRWTPPGQLVPGMLSYPYAGFALSEINPVKSSGYMDNHNAIHQGLPGKTWPTFSDTDLPVVFHGGDKFSVNVHEMLVSIKHKWGMKDTRNRKHEFDLLYTMTPENLNIPKLPIRSTVPPEMLDRLMGIAEVKTPGELLAFIRLRRWPDKTEKSRAGFELVQWGGKTWLTIIHHLDQFMVSKESQKVDSSEATITNGVFTTWKASFGTESIVRVPVRYVITVFRPDPNSPMLTLDPKYSQAETTVPVLAWDMIDYSKTTYSSDFLRLLTIHTHRFIPGELDGIEAPANLLGGNITDFVKNNDIVNPADFGHWKIFSVNNATCHIGIGDADDIGLRSLTIRADDNVRTVVVLETTVLNELPEKGSRVECSVHARCNGGMIAVYPGNMTPSANGNMIGKAGQYKATYLLPESPVSARIMLIIPKGEICRIYHVGMYRVAAPGIVVSFRDLFPEDYVAVVKHLRKTGRNIDNMLIPGVHTNTGITYAHTEYAVDWKNFTVVFSGIQDAAANHQLIIKATPLFEEAYRSLGRNAAFTENVLQPGDIIANL